MKVKSVLSAGVLLAASFFTAKTEAQTITTPRVASPAAEVSQTVGISKVTVKYSRPSVKDREIWGKLVPYGYNNLGFGTAVHDSLGEAYKVSGQDKLAVKNLKKSLSLNPPANVKANSIKLLKELGVDYASTE